MIELENKEDLRIVKTKNALRESLIVLMKDKPFEEIKISDVCNKALINRSTFYAHYEDKYELLVDTINYYKEKLTNSLEKNNNIFNTKEFYLELIRLILENISQEKNFYCQLFTNNHNSILMDILEDSIMKDINKRVSLNQINTKNIPPTIYIKYYLGAVTNVCIEWLNNQNHYTEKEIISYLDKLLPDDIGQ